MNIGDFGNFGEFDKIGNFGDLLPISSNPLPHFASALIFQKKSGVKIKKIA